LQQAAQEAKQASTLKSEQVAAVAQALRGYEGRSGLWYTVLANLFSPWLVQELASCSNCTEGGEYGVEGPNARKRTVRNMNTGDFPGI
jgi:hypothetical protein